MSCLLATWVETIVYNRGSINVFSKRATGFDRQAKLFELELNFCIRKSFLPHLVQKTPSGPFTVSYVVKWLLGVLIIKDSTILSFLSFQQKMHNYKITESNHLRVSFAKTRTSWVWQTSLDASLLFLSSYSASFSSEELLLPCPSFSHVTYISFSIMLKLTCVFLQSSSWAFKLCMNILCHVKLHSLYAYNSFSELCSSSILTSKASKF